MARKKYEDEDEHGDNNNGSQPDMKCQNHHQTGGNSMYPKHHFLGGGTKNRQNAKNSDESQSLDVEKQLLALGLYYRSMPGDGNCLFRALSDQMTGSSRSHYEFRRDVVTYMKENRSEFEPFVEDDIPFDKYIQRLGQSGTFAGNDAIVAFCRIHNVSVVIHQLGSPTWVIHPSSEEHVGGREVHVLFTDGNHYNSVRAIGEFDNSESPTNIRLHVQSSFPKVSSGKSPPHSACSNVPTSSYPELEVPVDVDELSRTIL